MALSTNGRAAFLTNFRQASWTATVCTAVALLELWHSAFVGHCACAGRDGGLRCGCHPSLQLRDAGRQGAPSRGALPVNFVNGQAGPEEYLAGVDAQVRQLVC